MLTEEIIKASHDAGFFSVCTINLTTTLDYFNRNQKFCKLDTSSQWNLYKDEAGDVYDKFFQYNEHTPQAISQKYLDSDTEIQFSNYKKINYDLTNIFISKYFSFSDRVLDIKTQLLDKYNISTKNTISVFYRGGDKYRETNLPSYEDMDFKLKEIYNKYPDNEIIVQSDEQEFCDYISNRYKKVIVFEEAKKLSKCNKSAVQYHTNAGEKVINAQIFLAIMSIVSQTQHIVLNSGNVGLFVCLFRGNADNVDQFYSPINTNDIFWY
jgi:hypothetical protein